MQNVSAKLLLPSFIDPFEYSKLQKTASVT